MSKNRHDVRYAKYLILQFLLTVVGTGIISILIVNLIGLEGVQAIKTYLLVNAVGLVLGFISVVFVNEVYIKPINKVNLHLKKLKMQDLTYRTEENIGILTPVGKSLNVLSDSWEHTVYEMQKSYDSLSESSTETKKSVLDTDENFNKTLKVITNFKDAMNTNMNTFKDSSNAIEELAGGVSKVAEATSSIAESSQTTLDETNEGKVVVNQLKEQMTSISKSMLNLSNSIEVLQNDSDEIGLIVSTIKEIAKQTHLLSLNATIEAARAGEQGRGFAVVANEVGKLSQETTLSAEKITGLIEKIQKQTSSTVSSMNSSRKEVVGGVKVVDETFLTFDKIVYLIEKITTEIQEISAISEQMAAGTQEVSSSVSDLYHNSKQLSTDTESLHNLIYQQKDSLSSILTLVSNNDTDSKEIKEHLNSFKIK